MVSRKQHQWKEVNKRETDVQETEREAWIIRRRGVNGGHRGKRAENISDTSSH